MQETFSDLVSLSADDLFAYAIDHVSGDGKSTAMLTADWDKLKTLYRAERQLRELATQGTGQLFDVELTPNGRSHRLKVERRALPFMNLVLTGLASYPERHPGHSFTAAVTLFSRIIKRFRLDELDKTDLCFRDKDALLATCKLLNNAVEALCAELNSPSFRAAQKRRTRNSRQVLNRACRWFDDALSEHKKLCVVRVDLYYKKKFQWTASHAESVTMDECFVHRERFIRALPKLFGKRGIRYLASAVKTEFTMRRSLHHHVLILLDGQKHQEGVSFAKMAGQLWVEAITDHLGDYHNVNLHTDPSLGTYAIGQLDADDEKKIANFKEHVLGYLVKPDHYVKWVVPQRHHLFSKTVYRLKAGKKLGRPRKGPANEAPGTSRGTCSSGPQRVPGSVPTP